MHLHIIGICGTFMGGVARLAIEAGHRVTGCDAAVYPPMSDQLRSLGIDLIEGFEADQLALAPDIFVVGNAVSRGNPLFEAVLDRGLPFTSGPAWVAQHILRGRHVIAVAGTHGKTTTTSMLAWILQQCGLDPGYLIGGVPLGMGASARRGTGAPFVIEADEYDTALFDKRSKFVHYFPATAILNNLEFDHADIFPDLAAIETQFHHLVRCIPRSGCVISNGAEASLERVLSRGCWSRQIRFNQESDWHWREVPGSGQAFEVLQGTTAHGTVAWGLSGDHNRHNAVAAIAAAVQAGVAAADAAIAISSFPGVRRRLECRGIAGGVSVYDDFAHHPTAMRVTLEALRGRERGGRILAVFEPRSQTMRLGTMQDRLAPSLAGADLVFCHAPAAGSHALGWNAAAALEALGPRARVFGAIEALVDAVVAASRPGDHILVMSNGGFGGIHEKLLDRLSRPEAVSPDSSR